MIRFRCENCGCKIKVTEDNAGKKGKCPKCKKVLVVPEKNDNDLAFMEKPGELKLQGKQDNPDATVEDTTEYYHYPSEHISEPEYDGLRKLPWFIDIFMYPISLSGLMHIAVFVIIPIIAGFLLLLGFFVRIGLFLYLGWYLTECVRDSAKGGTRAPKAFAHMGLGEMWEQVQHIVGVYLIYLTPAMFYNLYANRYDVIFWVLLVTGSFFFPMALLTCIMFDSIRGLNPFLLLGSIFSTFFQYCGLVLLIICVILSFVLMSGGLQNLSKNILIENIIHFIQLYMVFIVAHLIGRFYWRNEEKLNWEC